MTVDFYSFLNLKIHQNRHQNEVMQEEGERTFFTLSILMDFPTIFMHLVWDSALCYLMGQRLIFLYNDVSSYVSKDCFILANCADADEMPHHAAFHLGLYCLPKYLVPKLQCLLKVKYYLS